MPTFEDSSLEQNNFCDGPETLSSESESDDPDFTAALHEAISRVRGLGERYAEASAARHRRRWLQPIWDYYEMSLPLQTGSESQPLGTILFPAVPLRYPTVEELTAIAASSASSESPWSHVASAD